MAPERSPKRQKTIPDVDISPSGQSLVPPAPAEGSSDSVLKLPQSAAPPVTELARDSIPSPQRSTPESPRVLPSKPASLRSPSLAMALGKKQNSRPQPVDATTSKIHAEVGSPGRRALENTKSHVDFVPSSKKDSSKSTKSPEQPAQQQVASETKPKSEVDTGHDAVPHQRGSWLGWLGKTNTEPTPADGVPSSASEARSEPSEQAVQHAKQPPEASKNISGTIPEPVAVSNTPTKKSWLPWNKDTSEPATNQVEKTPDQEGNSTKDDQAQAEIETSSVAAVTPSKPTAIVSSDPATVENASSPPDLPHDGTKPSAWAFWSRERKVNSSSSSVDVPHSGEIAISDTPSQGHPQKTSITLSKSGARKTGQDTKKVETKTSQTEPSKNANEPGSNKKSSQPESSIGVSQLESSKRSSQPESDKKSGQLESSNQPNQPESSKNSKPDPDPVTIEGKDATATMQPVTEKKQKTRSKSPKACPNILLPELESTLRLPDHPSIVQQLARMLRLSKEPESKHLSLNRDPPRIRNALAIGVHGYFPAAFIRSVLGQPTGTSIRFADMAGNAIKRWTKARGYECQVKTAALEGEGKIAERVELLWKLLLNWVEEIRKSDFVLIACHSQGVPVATMLVAKLIQFGCLTGARVGICAMAGVNMGPFAEYKTRWIGSSAAELFEFTDPASKVSTDYQAALQIALNFGVHMTLVGSVDDQLVSLESSIFSPISHPNIYRAVSIDVRLHAPDFLSHLVAFAMKLRNLGIPDHGLIRELSAPLAGSLVSGKGHSRIYESDSCYDLAVNWTLLTTSMVGVPVIQQSSVSSAANPYILPFAMRGILEEEFVRKELHGEASDLLKQFDDWKPTTKALKDVKFRLEGIRSKL